METGIGDRFCDEMPASPTRLEGMETQVNDDAAAIDVKVSDPP
jgi:hypothetical protein